MWAAVTTVLLGVAGWLAASFFGRPLLEFYELRRDVHQEILFTDNIGTLELRPDGNRAKFDEAVITLRRLGTKLHAFNVRSRYPLRAYLGIGDMTWSGLETR